MASHAIVVGIDAYERPGWKLSAAVADALRFTGWALDYGGVAPEDPTLLLSPELGTISGRAGDTGRVDEAGKREEPAYLHSFSASPAERPVHAGDRDPFEPRAFVAAVRCQSLRITPVRPATARVVKSQPRAVAAHVHNWYRLRPPAGCQLSVCPSVISGITVSAEYTQGLKQG